MTYFKEIDWDARRGGLVRDVERKSLAFQAGIRPGDELLAVNRNRVNDVIDVNFYGAEETIELLVRRGTEYLVFELEREYGQTLGLEFDPGHATSAGTRGLKVVRAAAESLPYPDDAIDLVLSHEVLEHVSDDRCALEEIVRVLRIPKSDSEAGRLVLFVPNRGYPFETHGIMWRGKYRFGNIPLVNYLPRRLRDRLAPHVRIYTRRDLKRLIDGLPLRVVHQSVIYGAYDNIIARWPVFGASLRWFLHWLERTPLQIFGLSHLWVLERKTGD